uniref:PWWP domain-containing protein n=1 Tax=Trichuris muris TaxID=70415 RepID=A0A5S6Q582_TRIMR
MYSNGSPADELMVKVDFKCDYMMMVSAEINGSVYCGVMMKMNGSSDLDSSFTKRSDLWKELSSTGERRDIPDDPKVVSSVVLRPTEGSSLGNSCTSKECLNGFNHYLRPKRRRRIAASTFQVLESRLRTLNTGPVASEVKKREKARPCTLKITYGKRTRKKTTVINMPDEYAGTSNHNCTASNNVNDKWLDEGNGGPAERRHRPRNDHKRFSVGDIVWAKMRGYSHWPAEVHRLGERKLCVLWCGTPETSGIVPLAAVEPFQEKFADYYNCKHTRAYQNAVAIAMVKEIFNLRAVCHSSLMSEECQDTLLDLLASMCPRCRSDRT